MSRAIVPLHSGAGWRSTLFGMCPTPASRALALVLLTMGVVAWLGAALAWFEARDAAVEIVRSEDRANHVDATVARARTAAPPVNERLASEMATTVRRLNFPWPTVLDDLERLTPERVAILELSPDAGREQVQLLVQAPTAADGFEMVERLKAAHALSATRVLRYESRAQANTRAVQFLLQADLRLPTGPVPGQGGSQ